MTLQKLSLKKDNISDKIRKGEEKKNKEIIIQEDFNKNLSEWKMPKYEASKIYKSTGSFIKKTDAIIEMVEQPIPLSEEYKSFQLFSKNLVKYHREKHRFLHTGMVQIALKPVWFKRYRTYLKKSGEVIDFFDHVVSLPYEPDFKES